VFNQCSQTRFLFGDAPGITKSGTRRRHSHRSEQNRSESRKIGWQNDRAIESQITNDIDDFLFEELRRRQKHSGHHRGRTEVKDTPFAHLSDSSLQVR